MERSPDGRKLLTQMVCLAGTGLLLVVGIPRVVGFVYVGVSDAARKMLPIGPPELLGPSNSPFFIRWDCHERAERRPKKALHHVAFVRRDSAWISRQLVRRNSPLRKLH